jgi:hypothetical protein
MEYFLNCCWLLLFVPAFCIWHGQTKRVGTGRHRSMACLLALVCAVFLLFPVISASDDLHAMRAELEESGSGKRTFRQAPDQRTCSQSHFAPPAARLTPVFVFSLGNQVSRTTEKPVAVPSLPLLSVRSSRAPPALQSPGS